MKVMAQVSDRLRSQLRTVIAVTTFVVVLAGAGILYGAGDTAASRPPYAFDAFIYIGETPAWIGDRIHYTVYETAKVESRFLSATGEIMLLLPVGEQTPGQYTVPWDGTVDGAPMAGFYTFELYFGDEYAAKYSLIVSPINM